MKFESEHRLELKRHLLNDISLSETELKIISTVFGRPIYPANLQPCLFQNGMGNYNFYFGYTDEYLRVSSVDGTDSDIFNRLLSLDKRLKLFKERDVIALLIFFNHVKLYNEPIMQVFITN